MKVNIALLTVTDTRTFDNDKSGGILVKKIKKANHNLIDRKNLKLRCGDKDTFLISDIYEETFKRIVSPIYIIILSLICSLLILNSKDSASRSLFKFFLFLFGFSIIIFSELSYKFVNTIFEIELIFLTLPIIFVILFYFFILLKTNFKLRYL